MGYNSEFYIARKMGALMSDGFKVIGRLIVIHYGH